jgi:hypothetical protein
MLPPPPDGAYRRMIRSMSSLRSMLCRKGLFAALAAIAAAQTIRADVTPTTEPAPATQPAAAPSDPASIKQWFAQLADADPAVRDEATSQLMGLSRADLPALRQIVQDEEPLAPAQIEALEQIAEQVFLSGDAYATDPNGFLGIQTDVVNLTSVDGAPDDHWARGIMVLKRISGFCGARSLRDGDIIMGIEEAPGVTFTDPSNFVQTIRGVGPGNTIHLQVLRAGNVRRVAVTLDPRPTEIDMDPTMSDLVARRRGAFQAFWEKTFAPLLKEQVSGLQG